MTARTEGARPTHAELMAVCDSLYERLRMTVGLTAFRLELQRPGTPLVIAFHAPEALTTWDPRHTWMRAAPARIDLPLSVDGRLVACLRLADERKESYPAEALETCEGIARAYVRELSAFSPLDVSGSASSSLGPGAA